MVPKRGFDEPRTYLLRTRKRLAGPSVRRTARLPLPDTIANVCNTFAGNARSSLDSARDAATGLDAIWVF